MSIPKLEQDDIAKVVEHKVEVMAKEPISFWVGELGTLAPGEEPFSTLRRLVQIRDSMTAQGHDLSAISTMIQCRVKALVDLEMICHPGELILFYGWYCKLT